MRRALANDIALVIRITKRESSRPGSEGSSCFAEVHAGETSISAADEGGGGGREEGKKML